MRACGAGAGGGQSMPDRLFEQTRGYFVVKTLLSLWRAGLLQRSAEGEVLHPSRLASSENMAEVPLTAVLDYLVVRGYFEKADGTGYALTSLGTELIPYSGYLAMHVGAYEPVMNGLEGLLAGSLRYGADLTRSASEMVTSLTSLEEHQLGAVMSVISARPYRKAVDLGCGSGKMLTRICAPGADIHGIGIDLDDAVCGLARTTVERAGLASRITILQGDAGSAGGWAAPALEGVDLVTVMFLMHEILRQRGREGTVECLSGLRRHLAPGGRLVMVEVARGEQVRAREDLLFVPEYEMLHVLSDQQLASQAEWEEMIADAGFRKLELGPADLCQAFYLVAGP